MLHFLPLLAQASNKSDAMAWALVLFCVILGLLVTLNPSRRTHEIKRTKEE
jgi:CHASE1-domain containing sensor protein